MHFAIVALFLVYGVRLFYIQVLRRGHYNQLALTSQLKHYEIIPERGTIYARDGDRTVPIVLNEKRYKMVADPSLIKKVDETANTLAPFVNVEETKKHLNNKDSRYEILVKNLDKNQAEQIRKLELAGVFLEEYSQRIYPQGAVAASLLGFVDDEGVGKYGVEQALNDKLHGKNGKVKSITDSHGVPLLASGDNVDVAAVDGKNVVLSIDISIQRQVEDILKAGLDNAKSSSGGVIVMRPDNGEVVAMASYPTYDPAKYFEQKDPSVFINSNVATPFEVGSIMKPLTVAAALDQGVVNANTSYYDPSYIRIDDATVTNIEEDGGAATQNLESVLVMSLNTGAAQMLRYMGGGEFNSKGRNAWHDYMVNHYMFGKITGIEQGYEEPGVVPDPDEGYGLNIRYANTAFGQGMTETPIQMGAAISGVVNGGSYYQPTLVHGYKNSDGSVELQAPNKKRDNVVSAENGALIRGYMEKVVYRNIPRLPRDGYSIGGKTGTAQIANPAGGYYDDRFNGSYMGFVGGDKPEYVIIVRVDDPKIAGYAGSRAAAPIFSNVTNLLIDNFNVQAKK